MPVKNIQSIKYFLDRWEHVDPEYQYSVPYHDSVDGTTTWKDHVAAVKTANPIPTE